MNCRPDGQVSNPTKTLFVTRTVRSSAAQTALDSRTKDLPIDVVGDDDIDVGGGVYGHLPYLKEQADKVAREVDR